MIYKSFMADSPQLFVIDMFKNAFYRNPGVIRDRLNEPEI